MRKFALICASILLTLGASIFFYKALEKNQEAGHASPSIRPIAEFEATYAVALSEELLNRESGILLLKEILSAGAKVYLFRKDEILPSSGKQVPPDPRITQEEWALVTPIQIDHESFWLRDYLPIPLLKLYPQLPATPSFLDFVYRDAKSFDDVAMYQFALAIDSSIEHLPIVLDGGNFMTDGETCIVTQDLKSDTSTPHARDLKTQELLSLVQNALGCHTLEAVTAIPHPHVDMWMKFIGKGHVLINQIEDRTLALAKSLSPEEQQRIMEIQKALDQTATHLGHTLKVSRIPMPLPIESTFLTYANAVIVNHKIVFPSYSPGLQKNAESPDSSLYKEYETRMAEFARSAGFESSFINADQLIHEGGAFHCVSYHLNNLEEIATMERNTKKL